MMRRKTGYSIMEDRQRRILCTCKSLLNLTVAEFHRMAGEPQSRMAGRDTGEETLIYPGISVKALHGKVKGIYDNDVRA